MGQFDTPDTIYSVSSFVEEVKYLLESSYRTVWIEGEISGLARPASGHLYFSLKEKNALIRCAFFRNRRAGSVNPEEGMQVLLRGQISVYAARGDLQLIVNHIEPAGEGALRRAFEQLKLKLKEEGLFDATHKLPIPTFPKTIGIITSATGAALHDILVTIKRRFPIAHVIVCPSIVQGDTAVDDICNGLARLQAFESIDVVLLARGGGSLEDLQAFNNEEVARAIYHFPIPIVTGVGHEVDFTIADFVADHRAATPTAAAEFITPEKPEIINQIRWLTQRVVQKAQSDINAWKQQVDFAVIKLVHPAEKLRRHNLHLHALHHRLLNCIQQKLTALQRDIQRHQDLCKLYSPARTIRQDQLRINMLRKQLRQFSKAYLQQLKHELQQKQNTLQLINPAHTLSRGYSILQDSNGNLITAQVQAKPGKELQATVADGKFFVTVNSSKE